MHWGVCGGSQGGQKRKMHVGGVDPWKSPLDGLHMADEGETEAQSFGPPFNMHTYRRTHTHAPKVIKTQRETARQDFFSQWTDNFAPPF